MNHKPLTTDHQLLNTVSNNVLAQLVAKFVGAGLTLLTTYYTIRLAGLDLYGDLTKILVLVAIGFTAIDFGLNAQAIRVGTTPRLLKSAVLSAFSARLFLSIIIIFVLNLLVLVLPGGYSHSVKTVFWYGSLAIIFQGIYTSGNAWFQANLSYWKSTLSVVAGSLVGTGLTLYFLFSRSTLSNLVFAGTLGYLVMAVCSYYLLPRFSKQDFVDSIKSILPTLKNSLILGLILVASVVASKIDTILLGIFQTSPIVGEYGFSYRIFEVILVLPVFVMNAVYPLLINQKNRSQNLLKNSLISLTVLGILSGIFLWVFAPLVYFVKPGLTITVSVLRILAVATPLFYITAPLMWHLITRRRDNLVLRVYLLAAIFNGISNCFVIPRYSAIGAAVVTGFTELLIFLCLLYYSRTGLNVEP